MCFLNPSPDHLSSAAHSFRQRFVVFPAKVDDAEFKTSFKGLGDVTKSKRNEVRLGILGCNGVRLEDLAG